MMWHSSFNESDGSFPPKDIPRKTAMNNKKEICWCKEFNKGTCTESGSHMGPVGSGGEKKWVQHICACWKLKKRTTHAENSPDCPCKEA